MGINDEGDPKINQIRSNLLFVDDCVQQDAPLKVKSCMAGSLLHAKYPDDLWTGLVWQPQNF